MRPGDEMQIVKVGLFIAGGWLLGYYLLRKWKPEPGMQVLGPGEAAAQIASSGLKSELAAYSQATGTPISMAAIRMHQDSVDRCNEAGWSTPRCVALAEWAV